MPSEIQKPVESLLESYSQRSAAKKSVSMGELRYARVIPLSNKKKWINVRFPRAEKVAVAPFTSDVDAITLAMADLAKSDEQYVTIAARAVVIAALANTLVKSSMAASLGSPELRRITLPISGTLFAAGIVAGFLV